MSNPVADFLQTLIPALTSTPSAGDSPAHAADAFMDALTGLPLPKEILGYRLFSLAVDAVTEELESGFAGERGDNLRMLQEMLSENAVSDPETRRRLWKAFFPEALYLTDDPEKQIDALRKRRTVHIRNLVPDPVENPVSEILFTSNVLVSPPEDGLPPADTDPEVASAAARAAAEDQLYWYDHPIAIGTAPESDEALYGLAGLADALDYEKKRGTVDTDAKLRVALSISVTHAGLRPWARRWLEDQISRHGEGRLKHLEVHAFSEDDCRTIIDLLAPFLDNPSELPILKEAFGVDGEYGRHYSFLKAYPALHSVVVDSGIRATFKIDLDQVFPQQALVSETGLSMLELFQTPLWGAQALDFDGKPIELGMIAGALVNEKDISRGLFTPDIPWPDDQPRGEDLLFFKSRPMAVSTRAEMMTRYDLGSLPDGRETALQRIHVTGGTNGIRMDALRRHRPFTPGFIGRAEDQAFILSALTDSRNGAALRYLHRPGLIMRHDKEAFAGGAVAAGKIGSYVGDLLRILVFSDYASFLTGGSEEIKRQTDPFTGAFITPFPVTLAIMRLALHLRDPQRGDTAARGELLEMAEKRLIPRITADRGPGGDLAQRWVTERRAWNAYYDALDRLEESLRAGEGEAEKTRKAFQSLFNNCRIHT